LQADEYEIQVGQTAELFKLYRSSPAEALQVMNSRRKQVQLETN